MESTVTKEKDPLAEKPEGTGNGYDSVSSSAHPFLSLPSEKKPEENLLKSPLLSESDEDIILRRGCRRKFVGLLIWLGSTGRTLVAVALAIIIGSIFKAEDVESDLLYRILELPGKVWVNGLKLAVLPLIASNMMVALHQLRHLPNGGKLGTRTLLYFFTTTTLAIFTSLIMVNIFLIPNMSTIDLEELGDDDIAEPETKKDVMGQVEGIVFGLVPGNIVDAAAQTNLMGVIFFSIIVGLAISRTEQDSAILKFFKELGEVMMTIIQMLVLVTPIGVFCLILPKVATIDLSTIGQYLGLLLAVLIVGLIVHTFITLPLLFFTIARKNPYRYMRNLLPSVLTALGTSSSAATLPVTQQCVVEKNNVDKRIADFVLPLGATVNMDGTAIKYPCMVIWLAYAQGMSFGPAEQIVLAMISVLTSVGSAPIPTAGLAMWIMVLEATDVPVNGLLGLLFGMEWLVDRLETMVNVTSDAIGAGILNSVIDLNKTDTLDGDTDSELNVDLEEERNDPSAIKLYSTKKTSSNSKMIKRFENNYPTGNHAKRNLGNSLMES